MAAFLLILAAACNHAPPENLDHPLAPPLGLYRCWAGGFAHLPAGTLSLQPGGHYESYRHHGGGLYSFSPREARVEFLNGDYHAWEYRGVVQRAPFAQTTAQGEGASERIVLLPLDVSVPIGEERPGEYQYCYRQSAVQILRQEKPAQP